MKTENEALERYLQHIASPDYEATGHQGRLRAELLARVERRQASGVMRGHWKTPVLVLGLLALAAAAAEVAVQVHKYYFEGRGPIDGTYVFSTGPGESAMVGDGGKERDAAGIEQKRKDLEEMALLRQQNARQLVSVTDTMVNGHPQGRMFTYKYQLSGGRTEITGECDAPGESDLSPAQEQQQIEEARRQGRKDVIKATYREVDGEVDLFLTCRYVLANGRGVLRAERDHDAAPPAKVLTIPQQIEFMRLERQKQGTNLGRFEATVRGQTFTFEKYAYRLSDGTAVAYAEAKPQGQKLDLTEGDWAELGKLRQAGAGEPLAEYTAEINGQTFLFKPKKYVLSGGTEVVQAPSQPVAVK